MNILTVKDLKKEYKNFTLDNINFKIPEGVIVALVGENGAGKSTLLNSILDLNNKSKGEIYFWNKKLDRNNKFLKENIGVVFDHPTLNETLKPKQFNKIFKNIYSNWDQELFFELLEKYELPDEKIKTFSNGMKMKFQFAIALAHHPKFLVLDEIFNGLDVVSKYNLLNILLEFIQDEKHSIIISSHHLDEIERISDYILFIHQGKQILYESIDELSDSLAIINCTDDQLKVIDNSDIAAVFKDKFYNHAIVKKKNLDKYYFDSLDKFSLDEFLKLYLRGKRNERFTF